MSMKRYSVTITCGNPLTVCFINLGITHCPKSTQIFIKCLYKILNISYSSKSEQIKGFQTNFALN
ncbi:hypothetical protein AD941_02940 [Gluconobacter albidus]|uniref:Uncharacterized protein n=1 Tax=Gluconobacter albidus TaxID=318683 RepID=A0AAW3R1U8_9PROT|nr:hypothetical protein AD941_02940 [Gluconobacter albidus]